MKIITTYSLLFAALIASQSIEIKAASGPTVVTQKPPIDYIQELAKEVWSLELITEILASENRMNRDCTDIDKIKKNGDTITFELTVELKNKLKYTRDVTLTQELLNTIMSQKMQRNWGFLETLGG